MTHIADSNDSPENCSHGVHVNEQFQAKHLQLAAKKITYFLPETNDP
jgi:hypothetical protein